jgi:hypothetical protein
MKKTLSILFIALFLLAGHRASGQELVDSIGDISNNFWGGSSMTASSYITFSDPSDIGASYTPRSFSCSAGDVIKEKGATPLSVQSGDTTGQFACGTLWNYGISLNSDYEFQSAYDTLRLFIESCPLYPNSWSAFSDVDGAVSGWSAGGAGRWPDFLTWLKQVLYLNPDTFWYCADAQDMMSALQTDGASVAAAAQYIIESNKCPAFTSAWIQEYNAASYTRHQQWLDSVIGKYDTVQPYGVFSWWVDSLVNKDTLANPYDSTIPSLQQENLQILLGPQYAGVQTSSPSAIGSQALLSAQLFENPIQNEIDVSYDMGRTALVTMELRDVLGRSVPLSYAKYQLEQPGDHNATIPAPNLPAGIYYLRITTDVGDAITLKIVKE